MLLKKIYIFATLCLAHSTLLQSPEDTEVVVGQDVTLKCRTDVNNSTSSVEWRYQAHPDALFETICKRKLIFGRFKGRYDVVQNTTTGQYDLIIKLVQLHDAGRYKCSHRESQSEAELVVFDKYPSNEFCTTTSTSNGNPNNCGLESVTMSCDLSYRGNLAPTLEWQQDGNTITSTVKNHTNGLITSSIHLQKGQFETAKYTCRVKYNPSAKTRFIWSSSENMTPIATTHSLSYGGCDLQTIDCSEGNSHQCTYTWTDENGTEVSSSSSMELTGKPNGNYTCSATCQVHSTSCPYVAKIFNYRCDYSGVSSEQQTSMTSSPGIMILTPQPIQSSLGIASREIYIPVSIVAIVILILIIILLVFRSSLCVCSERTYAGNDAVVENGQSNNIVELKPHLNGTQSQDAVVENGQSNNVIELTHLNGTQSQETDVMLTKNTPKS